MFGLGFGEGLVLVVLILVLFGGKRLPQLGRAMGQAITNFKIGLKDNENNNQNNLEDKK